MASSLKSCNHLSSPPYTRHARPPHSPRTVLQNKQS